MIIDCDTCAVRGPACGDCVVSVLLAGAGAGAGFGPTGAGHTHPPVELDDEHRCAIDVLAGSGLVPPLRLVVGLPAERPELPASEAG